MILCLHLTQEKVYHLLDVNFLMSDSFASCTEWTLLGIAFSVSLQGILGSKMVKQLKQDYSHS